MNYDEKTYKNFEYKKKAQDTYGKLFSPDVLGKYSGKIKNIVDCILKSEGIVLVYSQYIDGGCLPIALALESIGITRYGDKKNTLFKKEQSNPLQATTMKPYDKTKDKIYKPAKYIMITGNNALSPNNEKEIQAVTNENNKDGEMVKVVIISSAGSEGIDLRFLRQVHILEPWYNMSRIEQIIGRAVRFCSHKDLPFDKRNVEIYLHTMRSMNDYETMDMYIYRMAEQKAIQIGVVARVLKENAVDCMINLKYNDLTEENMNQTVKQKLSSGKTIDYKVGDKPFTQICDYMESCTYSCYPYDKSDTIEKGDVKTASYNENFVVFNVDKVIQRVKDAFKKQYIYKKKDLIQEITRMRKYPEQQIETALQMMIEEDNEFLVDMLGRMGRLININLYYMFQPLEIQDTTISRLDRLRPVDYKRDGLDIKLEDKLSDFILKLQEYEEIDAETETETETETRRKEDGKKEKPSKKTEKASKITLRRLDTIGEESEEDDDQERDIDDDGSKKRDKQSTKPVIKPTKRTTTTKPKKEPEVSRKINKIQKTLTMIKDNIGLAKTTTVIPRGDMNWYKHASLALNKMSSDNDIERKVLEKYILHHSIDTLTNEIKKELTEYLLIKEKKKEPFIDIEKEILDYIRATLRIFDDEETTEGYIYLEDTIQVYVFNKDSEKMEKPEPLDEVALLNQLIKQRHVLASYHTVVGFISYIPKTDQIVFKTKYIDLKRNKGARCDQAGKSFTIKTTNDIYGIEKYTTENTKDIKAPQLCSEQEIILRYYQDIKKDDKVWFLHLEEGVIQKIESITRAKK